MFVPGYDSGRSPVGGPAATQGGTAATGTSWYGSTAGGGAGKGPVRGYPPVPGQPPPMYPPGQFAAWNHRPGRPRNHTDQPGQPPDRNTAERDQLDSRSDPGYSVLAVSDPAADVTSTQTWQAVADGRATGTWTMPTRPGAGSSRPGTSPPGPGHADEADRSAGNDRAPASVPFPRGPAPGLERPGRPAALPPGRGDAAGRIDAGTALAGAEEASAAAVAGGTAAAPGGAATGAGRAAGAARRSGRGPGAHTGPHTVQRPRKRPASVKVAFSAALLLVVAAAGALTYVVLHHPAKVVQTTVLHKPVKSTPAPQPSPTLGVYGHIGSRGSDPLPLTVAQLYPPSFTIAGDSATRAGVTRTVSRESSHCGAAVVGSGLQSAISAGGCSQVVRATYLGTSLKMMGTIGVLNLKTGQAAKKAASSAGAANFIAQLRAPKGPTSKIGKGTGIEEAAAKGHYLILIWAEFTDLRKPKNNYQRSELVRFMTQMLDKTANVSLAARMATGTP